MLVQDQRTLEEAEELVEHTAEILDVVKREACDHRVERTGIVERLDRRPPEDRLLRASGSIASTE